MDTGGLNKAENFIILSNALLQFFSHPTEAAAAAAI